MKLLTIRDSVQKDLAKRLAGIIENTKDLSLIDTISDILHIFESSFILLEEDKRDTDQTLEYAETDLRSEIIIAVGHASMCWEYPERAGTFDTKQAIEIAQKLYDLIQKRRKEKEECEKEKML